MGIGCRGTREIRYSWGPSMILKLPWGAGAQVSLPPASADEASNLASPASGLLVRTRNRCLLPSSFPLTVFEPERGRRRPLRLRRGEKGRSFVQREDGARAVFWPMAQLSARVLVQGPVSGFNQTTSFRGPDHPATPPRYCTPTTETCLGLPSLKSTIFLPRPLKRVRLCGIPTVTG